MVWTAPMTAVDNDVFTAAQFNTHVRDNLLETMPGKSTTVGSYFVSDAANAISERFSYTETIPTSESIAASEFYGDLTTIGPTITDMTGGATFFLFLGAEMIGSAAGTFSLMGFDITGDAVVAADDILAVGAAGTGTRQLSHVFRIAPGTAGGTYTITAKYRSTSGTSTFANRWLSVLNF